MGTPTQKQIRYTHDLLGANPDDYASEPSDSQKQSTESDPAQTSQPAGPTTSDADAAEPNQSVGSEADAIVAKQPEQTDADQPNATVIPAAASIPNVSEPSDPQNQSTEPDAAQTGQPAGSNTSDADNAEPNQSVGSDADATVAKQPEQTNADQLNATVILAGASITAPGGPDPCLDILQQIVDLLDELAKRINDALDDPHDLFNKYRKVKDAHPQYGSWDGHEDRFKYDRDRLRQKIGEWEANDNCRGTRLSRQQQDELNEAYEYKEKEYPAKPLKSLSQQADPAPQPDSSTAEKVLKILLVLGLAIALVPTVVAALADPEPATKLALAGLTFVEITALAAALGFSAPKPPDGA